MVTGELNVCVGGWVGETCDGLVSHQEGSRNTPAREAGVKHQPDWPLGWNADFNFLPYIYLLYNLLDRVWFLSIINSLLCLTFFGSFS